MIDIEDIDNYYWQLVVLGRGAISKKTGKTRGRIWRIIIDRKDLDVPPIDETTGRKIIDQYNIHGRISLKILGGRGRIKTLWWFVN